MQRCQPFAGHSHRDQRSDEQTNHKPLPHILHHIYKSVVEGFEKTLPPSPPVRAGSRLLMLVAAAMLFMLLLLMVTAAMLLSAGLPSLTGGVGGGSSKPIHQPPAEHRRKQRCQRPYNSEGQSHERVGGGDAINTRLRRGNQEAGAGTVTGTLLA